MLIKSKYWFNVHLSLDMTYEHMCIYLDPIPLPPEHFTQQSPPSSQESHAASTQTCTPQKRKKKASSKPLQKRETIPEVKVETQNLPRSDFGNKSEAKEFDKDVEVIEEVDIEDNKVTSDNEANQY
jgi:hypothetical protein